jgi:hypothetical protein
MSSKFFLNKKDNKVDTKGKLKPTKQNTPIKLGGIKKAGRGK